jgi:hypothetical protein
MECVWKFVEMAIRWTAQVWLVMMEILRMAMAVLRLAGQKLATSAKVVVVPLPPNVYTGDDLLSLVSHQSAEIVNSIREFLSSGSIQRFSPLTK